MPAAFIIEGIPGALRALDELAPKDRSNAMRRAVRAGLQPMRRQLQFEGDTPGHPHSFTKVPPPRISTRGGASGREIEGYVRPKSPLFNIFEPGAKAHTITPGEKGFNSYRPSRPYPTKARKSGKAALAGPAGGSAWTNEGRKRPAAFFSRSAVRHPGMAARPILPAAFAAAVGPAEDAIANAIFAPSKGGVIGQ